MYCPKKYKLSHEQYEDFLKKQNECCAICKIHKKYVSDGLYVDHCHATMKVLDFFARDAIWG
jgi:hypothetical protein